MDMTPGFLCSIRTLSENTLCNKPKFSFLVPICVLLESQVEFQQFTECHKYSTLFLQVLFTYTANLLRLMRFGVTDAHGKAAALQLNRFLEEGAVQHLDTEGTYQVNFNKLKESVTSLVSRMGAMY